VEIDKNPRWSFRLVAGALGLVAMVLPRLPRIRPRDIVGGVIPVGPFSGGFLDGNIILMSALLIVFAGIMTWLLPTRAWKSAVILGLAPAGWLVIAMVLHGSGDIWPIALLLAVGYGALMATGGVGIGKFVARLSRAG
jgi:hypothetical protein